MRVQRAAASLAALGVLAASVWIFGFALYVGMSEDSELTGALGAFEMALAGAATTVAASALVAAWRGPFPQRSWMLMLLAVVLDAIWYAVVFTIAENA